MSSEKIAQIITVMHEYFRQDLSPMVLKVYLKGLSGYPEARLEEAIENAMMNSKFCPKIAEIKEYLEPQQNDLRAKAEAEFEKVRLHVVRSSEPEGLRDDPITAYLIKGAFSKDRLGQGTEEELNTWRKKEFIADYLDHLNSVAAQNHIAAGNGPLQRLDVKGLAEKMKPRLSE